MISRTGRVVASLPPATARQTTSRSVTMPASSPPAQTGMTPQSCSRMSAATCSMASSGEQQRGAVVMMSLTCMIPNVVARAAAGPCVKSHRDRPRDRRGGAGEAPQDLAQLFWLDRLEQVLVGAEAVEGLVLVMRRLVEARHDHHLRVARGGAALERLAHLAAVDLRSEERRVGKEGRSRWSP